MTARRIDRPEEGYYRARLRKGAPWVPARIISRVATDPLTGEKLDRSPVLVCMVAGEEVPVMDWWPRLHQIDEAEYERLVDGMPEEPRKPVDFLNDDILFGDPHRNSRDAQLAGAAEAMLFDSGTAALPEFAADVVTLVKQIIAWRDHQAALLAEAARPLKDALAALKAEHACESDTWRPRLLSWLAAWTDAHGGEPPRSQGCTAFWSTTTNLVADDRGAAPLEFMVPDESAIKEALKAGRDVPGWRLEHKREMRVG